jgi:hypothetical protein
MDVRDIYLIKKFGVDKANYLFLLAKDPTTDLLDQIKYSETLEQIRKRLYWKSKLDWSTNPYQ